MELVLMMEKKLGESNELRKEIDEIIKCIN